MSKNYVSLSKLSTFFDKLKSVFATKAEIEDKANVEDVNAISNEIADLKLIGDAISATPNGDVSVNGSLTCTNIITTGAASNDTTPSTAKVRQTALVDTDVMPTVDGVINWTYE